MAARRISKLLRSYHLRSVKSMKFTFDPYMSNVRSIRDVVFQMHIPQVVSSNPNTQLKVDVKSNGADPVIDVTFVDGHQLVVRTANLSTVQVLDHLWEMADSRDPRRGEVPALQTKAGKKKKR
ncbi:hypothetical protein ACOMHN_059140 [Nucella lapillus]